MVLQVWKLLQLRAGNIWTENLQLQRCEPAEQQTSTNIGLYRQKCWQLRMYCGLQRHQRCQMCVYWVHRGVIPAPVAAATAAGAWKSRGKLQWHPSKATQQQRS